METSGDLWNESVSTFSTDFDHMNGSDIYDNSDEYDSNTDDILQDMPASLRSYDDFHYAIHGYLALIIIFIGTIGNITSMVVLTRKNMVSAINIILTALAFADTMVLLAYLVKIKFHSDLQFMSYTEVTYSLAVFSLYISHFFILGHTLSVWLTVLVALWRVMAVCYPGPTMPLRSVYRAKTAIVCTYVACILVCIPEFLKKKIITLKEESGDKFVIGDSDIYIRHAHFFDIFDDWVFNMVLYLIPCIPLTVCTVALIRNLSNRKARQKEANEQSSICNTSSDRLTAILVFILVVFLVSKVPPGIMYFLDFAMGNKIVHQVHYVFSGTINILILLNSTVNSFIYFCMSKQFRATAYDTFCSKLFRKEGNMNVSSHQRLESSEMELSKY